MSESKRDQNVYEYKKVKIVDDEDWTIASCNPSIQARTREVERILRNKINELCIEQNHLMKDFELYKKAFKRYVEEHE